MPFHIVFNKVESLRRDTEARLTMWPEDPGGRPAHTHTGVCHSSGGKSPLSVLSLIKVLFI